MGMGQTIDINEFIRQAEKAIANGIATLDASAKIPKNQIDLTAADVGAIATGGTAATANQLTTPRTIATSGDAVYSVSFDGSANVSGAITLATVNSNVGSFGSATAIPIVTVDAKGRITAISTQPAAPSWDSIASKPNELVALQALADTVGFLRKTGDGAYSIDAASYLPTAGGTISGNVNLSSTTASTSPTTGASVIAGGQGISGDQHCGGFTSLGGVASGHPAYKIKEIEGVTGNSQGSVIGVAHGITTAKIKSAIVTIEPTNPGEIMPNSYDNSVFAGYQFTWSINGSLLNVILHATNSGSILSKNFRALIFYTA